MRPGIISKRESLTLQLIGAGVLELVVGFTWLGWRGLLLAACSLFVGLCFGVVHEWNRRAREVEQLGADMGHSLSSGRETSARARFTVAEPSGVVQEPPVSPQLLRQAVHCCCGRVCLTEHDWLMHRAAEPSHRPERVFSTFDCG